MWADPILARTRRQALRDTLLKIVAIAQDINPIAVLCGGDLYEHDRSSPDTGDFLRSTFEWLHPIPVFIAPGNHDWYGQGSLYKRTKWSPNINVMSGSQLQPATLADGLTLWGAAHHAPSTVRGFLESFRVDRSGIHIALFHGSERGLFLAEGSGKKMYAPFDADQIDRSGLHHIFLGHYHRPRDADRYTYPGNPDPLTLGEDGERGVVLITCVPDGTIRRERKRVAVSNVHDVEINITGCDNRQEVFERVVQALEPLSGVARVTLIGEVGTAVDLRTEDFRRQALAPRLDHLAVRFQIGVAYDFESIAQEQTVRGQFVRDVQASDLPEDEHLRVLVTGLRALEARNDLEVL